MGQHVQSLPVPLDLSGDVLILQDHALSSTLTPFCNHPGKKKKIKEDITNHIHATLFCFQPFSVCICQDTSQNLAIIIGVLICLWYKDQLIVLVVLMLDFSGDKQSVSSKS